MTLFVDRFRLHYARVVVWMIHFASIHLFDLPCGLLVWTVLYAVLIYGVDVGFN